MHACDEEADQCIYAHYHPELRPTSSLQSSSSSSRASDQIVRYGRSSINSLVIGRTIYILACREYVCNNQNIGITELNIEDLENENQFQ